MQATLSHDEARGRARTRRSWSGFRVLLVLALVNVIVGIAVFVVRPPSGTAPVESGLELPGQISDLQQRIADGRSGESYMLDLSDADLTAAAGYFAVRNPDVPFTRIHIATVGERLAIDAVTRGMAVPVPVQASVSIEAVDGVPRAHVEDVRVAGSGLPAFARDQVLRQANTSLDLSRYEMPITVDTLKLTPGRLVVEGRLR